MVIAVFIGWGLSTGILHPTIGPLVKIEDLAATRRNDGTYIYPILIRNTGDQPMLNDEIAAENRLPRQPDYRNNSPRNTSVA